MFAPLAVLLLSLAQSDSTSAGDQAPALEDVLADLRATRDRVLQELTPRVADAVSRLEALGAPKPRATYDRLKTELESIGAQAVPLFVAYLDPGEKPDGPSIFRAREIADLLAQLPVSSIVPELVELAESGTTAGRINAARVLGYAPLDGRVRDALRMAWESESNHLRGAALGALARLEDPESAHLISEALGGSNGSLAVIALEALVDVRAAGVAGDVRALLARPKFAGPTAYKLLEYYQACPQVFGDEEAILLLELVKSRSPKVDARVAILRGLQRMGLPSGSRVKSLLGDIASGSRGTDVEEEALITQALLGDRNAKKKVLAPYEKAVRECGSAGAFRERGEAYLRLADYRKAIGDLEEAIQMKRRRARDVQDEVLLLARAYARQGKEKEAADALASAGFSSEKLRELAQDPDFTAIAASPRYGSVFPSE